MPKCAAQCGFTLAQIADLQSAADCELNTRSNKSKGFIFQICQTASSDVLQMPRWTETTAIKNTWLDSQVDTFISLPNLRSIVKGKPETTPVKNRACDPSVKKVIKQTIEIEDVIALRNATDEYLDYTIYRTLQANIGKFNVLEVDCNNNIFPWVENFEAEIPKFMTVGGEFWTEGEELSECENQEVKKSTLETCYDTRGFNTPYLLGTDINPATLAALGF